MRYHLAIDIGASSGRLILSHLDENSKIVLEEVHRFKNGPIKKDNHLFWDIDSLYNSIIEGLKKCKEIDKIPSTFSIDTFGVDYALLDENDKLIRPIYCYRDDRNAKAKEILNQSFTDLYLFKESGIYPNTFNTIFQLYDDYLNHSLNNVKTILYIPSYLYFLLTGEKYNEMSFASTTGLLNASTHEYDEKLLSIVGLKKDVFAPFLEEGKKVGELKKEIQDEIGFNVTGVMCFTHDTASAVYASNIHKNEIFLSSGTWSLMGVLLNKSLIQDVCFASNFTNELNDINTVRFLKNINGMYIVNRVNDELNKNYSFVDIVEMSKNNETYEGVFDVNDPSLLAPINMISSIKSLIKQNGFKDIKNDGELFYCIYHSLVISYKECIEQIKDLTKKDYDSLVIFGGGSQNLYLNDLIKKHCHISVKVKEKEATAIGNIISQIKYTR